MIIQLLIITLLSCTSPSSNLKDVSSENSPTTRIDEIKLEIDPNVELIVQDSHPKHVDRHNVDSIKKDPVTETTKQEEIESGIDPAVGFDHSHTLWHKIVAKNISSEGVVNYKAIKLILSDLQTYLAVLENQDPINSSWTRAQKMAFWINTYNAHTIKLIIDNYPLKSILNLDGGKVWDRSWITIGNIEYSLNDIEHKILRPIFKDPRIHFAVNCAAQSCPPMWNKAWTSLNLESGLETNTKKFVNNAKYNELSESKVSISKIFEWYGQDFGQVLSFVKKYSNTNINGSAKVSFKEYNWDLND